MRGFLKKGVVFLGVFTSVLLGCEIRSGGGSGSELTYVVETGVSALSGVLDDQANSSYAVSGGSSFFSENFFLKNSPINPGLYASCSRAYSQPCSSFQKSITYSSCSLGNTSLTLTGSITLNFSDSQCLLTTSGQWVSRSYDYTIQGPRGGALRIFSSSANNYKGESLSGGGKLTKTSSGWELQILGKHKILTSSSQQVLFNHSLKTTSPITVIGSLDRSQRVLYGGAIEVYHNLSEYVVSMEPTNLTWNSSCCHPVSGSLALTLSGSKTGTATVTFNSCGSATVVYEGESHSLSMSYCE